MFLKKLRLYKTNYANSKKVKEALREEVGFGCPVTDCGNPYLEYHHFDPAVHVKPHIDPRVMIALCAQYHKKLMDMLIQMNNYMS
ncbi:MULTISPECIES: hypothetical protein [unclassified Vibrio]|uniref:hypothetical protein n=1 Tax=unclassified Vibrio TaxID=2614977 RepID=UPI0035506A7A